MASKTKSSLSETPPNKASPATPRVNKPVGSRGIPKSDSDSHSPLPNSRLSIDRSPRSVPSKTAAVDRRSPRITTTTTTTTPEKQPSRIPKGGSELQTQLNLVQEDLKKAKEHIILVEKEKAKAIDELKEAQKVAEETNEKLREALVAQKRAEESSEIEKFRAVELEQAGIEAAQKKEEEWQKEIESVRNQHAVDVAALLSTTQELQRLKHELAMTCDAKNQAMSHADDATKIAEIQAEKAEILSAELARLKALLDSKIETETNEINKTALKLNSEIESLRQQLEEAKIHEEKILLEKEACIEQLNVELEAAKMAESYARSLAEEWKIRVDEMERQVEEARKLEISVSESLDSVMKQLEGSNDLLHDAEAEIAVLKEKVGLLEITIGRQKGDLEESEHQISNAKQETSEMAKIVESLKAELENVKEEKIQALNNEKLAASSVQTLLEEKNKLLNELENSRNEEEKSKKAMESLASALHEVSAEAREAKEKLLSSEVEHENYDSQMEDLKLVLKATKEKYEALFDEAKHEIDCLTSESEKTKTDFENSKAEWEEKELHLVDCVKKSEEESSSMEKEVNRLVNLLKRAEEEACDMKEEEVQLKDSLKEVESEAIYLQEALAKSKAETMKLKENVLDKENELQSLVQENEELREKEAASLKKVEELSKALEEAITAKKQSEENGEVTDSEKDYDLLPKVVEFSEENGHAGEDKKPNSKEEPAIVLNSQQQKNDFSNDEADDEHLNGKPSKELDEKKEKGDEAVEEVEYKMWESCKIEKEFSPEREGTEQESFEEDVDTKAEVEAEGGESFDQINGVSSTENNDDAGGKSSPTKQQQQKKKKKPLLGKFGSLLKKKAPNNQK
ncbi:WEB family protein At5g16730, chloroplastic isoform X2 [Morus notabilis]|uniref:WEB family protein At5g16730, chloroplastic isoform X2 n=1 Tax=Morus notabilis TaxID=981085 RepID=UPI000CED3E27|nr:WEB family protein At5g16730, chloroplastic isoform X2 [Morus notabilis]